MMMRSIYQRHGRFDQHPRNVKARAKMYVPSDSFGGISPEKKASQALQNLFTFISAKIVLAQLEGSGRGALAAYNKEGYETLFQHLHDVPLTDAHKWLEQLMHKDKAIALRLMEVRAAYSKEDFEWDQLQRLSTEAVKKSNLQLMRQAAAASLQATTDAAAAAATANPDSEVKAQAAEQGNKGKQEHQAQTQAEEARQGQPQAQAGVVDSSSSSSSTTDTAESGENRSNVASAAAAEEGPNTSSSDSSAANSDSSNSSSTSQQQLEQ